MVFNWRWVRWVHLHHFFEALQRCALCQWAVGHTPETGTHRLQWQPEPPLLHESSHTACAIPLTIFSFTTTVLS